MAWAILPGRGPGADGAGRFWTWFGLMNARLLRAAPQRQRLERHARRGGAAVALARWPRGHSNQPWPQVSADASALAAVALVTGVIGGWWASWLWSQASVRLPVTLAAGQLDCGGNPGRHRLRPATWQWPDWPLLLGGALDGGGGGVGLVAT